jgi:gamma-resorcylate decarboxylase
MDAKIALEEHFGMEETLSKWDTFYAGWFPDWPVLRRNMLDLTEHRIDEMDKHGVESAILSMQIVGCQAEPDPKKSAELARRGNDHLAAATAKRSGRLYGFAALPLQDPDAAIIELNRCIKDLGFKGVHVNGFSQVGTPENVVYLDDPRYLPFWAAVEQLDVPLYLHPRDPLTSREPIYEGHPWLRGSAWAFTVETATHALRIMASGVFDRYPKVNVILGHLGEGLPYSVWRIDHRISRTPRGIPAKRKMADYLRENFYLTTSGNFRTQSLINAILEIGSDRLLYSCDYPMEDYSEASEWFDNASISETDRIKIGRTNALKLFKLSGYKAVSR